VIGFFRLWTIPLSEPLENGGLNGWFDPPDERVWEEHGRALLSIVIHDTKTLPCAEDLGVVPECSYRVLRDFGVPGTDVQRWMRVPESGFDFRPPKAYRENSMSVISTHDLLPFRAWWEYEAGTVDELFFKRKLEARGISLDDVRDRLFDLTQSSHERLRWREEITSAVLRQILNRPECEIKDIIDTYLFSYREKERFWKYAGLGGRCEKRCSGKLVKAALAKISETASIFSIQLIQDWLALGGVSKGDSWEERINFPGVMSARNWSYVLPVSLEKMISLPLNREIKSINAQAGRI
jgi:4-alpha-glucanotransferase